MARPVKEWMGKTDATKAPPRVRQRVFDGSGGICHLCKQPIKVPFESWQADHVIALINGGENKESNLAPAHSHCHLEKTKTDVAVKRKIADIRQKHLGISGTKQKIQSRGFRTTEKAQRIGKQPLAPRPLYEARTK